MYNRYIPQPDGSYRRDLIRTKEPMPPQEKPPQVKPAPPPPDCPEPAPPPPSLPPKQCSRPTGRKEARKPQTPAARQGNDSIPSFLKQLLPGDLDTGDLLVIVLLLLMAGDCSEDRNHALLTLVLYLFL